MSFLPISKRFLVAAALLASASANAADGTAALQRFLDRVQTLEARFAQTQSDENGKLIQSSSGQMWLQRASSGTGRFRWDYAKPYEQQIVCDGSRIWLYDPDLAQVTVRPAVEALKGTPAALLSQRAALQDQFSVEDAGRDDGLQKLRLAPKARDSEFREVLLWMDGDTPARMRFTDPLGGSTEIRFSDTRSNGKLKAALFEFKPPKDVEVVEAGGDK